MRFLLPVLGIFLPNILFAQGVTLFSILFMALGVFTVLVRVGLAVALVVFIWGVVKMIVGIGKPGSEAQQARIEGKSRMIWGVVGLFMIVSIWGVVTILAQIAGVDGAATTQPAPIITY